MRALLAQSWPFFMCYALRVEFITLRRIRLVHLHGHRMCMGPGMSRVRREVHGEMALASPGQREHGHEVK